MSDAGARPPSEGWYSIDGNPDDLAYFNGELWTWRRQRDPNGEWHEEPIVPPIATTPAPAASHGAPSPAGPPTAPATPSQPYSGMPAYPGAVAPGSFAGGQWGVPPPSPPPIGHLDLHLAEPERQARWRTLLRGLLVIPNLIVLAFLEIAVLFVTILLWFAALFTARVPEDLWRFSVGVLKWQARTYAFTFFLTDRYPPFKMGDAPYPVSMTLGGPPDRFNRFAVFFRFILIFPAVVVVEVFSIGVAIFSVFAWLATLVAGRCPRSLHLMIAAWLRYSLRTTVFEVLLTTEYPSRPLGDTHPDYGEASLQNGDIVLTGSAKALSIVAIVIGVLAYFGSPVLEATVVRTKAQSAISQLNALESRNLTAEANYRNKADSCSTWTCLRDATPILLHSLDTQISSLEAITFPSPRTQDDANGLIAVLRRSVLTRTGHAASRQQLETDLDQLLALTKQVLPLAAKLEEDLNAVD